MTMLRMKRLTEMTSLRAYTDSGEYFGDIEEAILTKSKVDSWRIKATKNSYLNRVLGSAKGVIVPHTYVKAIGDVVIISSDAVPSSTAETVE